MKLKNITLKKTKLLIILIAASLMFSFTYVSCDIASASADEANLESDDISNDTDNGDSNNGNDSGTDNVSNTNGDSETDSESNDDSDSETDGESNDDSDSETDGSSEESLITDDSVSPLASSNTNPSSNPAFPETRATVSIPEGALVIFDSDKGIDKINNTAIWGNATLSNVTVDGKTVKKYELGSGNDKAFVGNLTETFNFPEASIIYLSVYANNNFKFAYHPGENGDIPQTVKWEDSWDWYSVLKTMTGESSMNSIAFSSDSNQVFYIDHIYIVPHEPVIETINLNDYEIVWQDEFDGTSLDTSKWKYETGASGWGNNELQNYIDDGRTTVVNNGTLKIKAFKENDEWKSARINSKTNLKYGYIEARMKITDKKGAWPAFWMLGENIGNVSWPDCGEIDIMENAPSTFGDGKVFGTLHARGHHGGAGISIGSKTIENLSSEWHTCAVLWTEEKITLYIDGVKKNSYNSDGTTENWPYNQNFYILLNLAIGGDLGNTNDAASLTDAQFEIDYVRWYQ